MSEQEDMKEMKRRILDVMKGTKGRGMTKDSCWAAVQISMEIEQDQALLRMLQNGELEGRVDEQGEVILDLGEGPPGA